MLKVLKVHREVLVEHKVLRVRKVQQVPRDHQVTFQVHQVLRETQDLQGLKVHREFLREHKVLRELQVIQVLKEHKVQTQVLKVLKVQKVLREILDLPV